MQHHIPTVLTVLLPVLFFYLNRRLPRKAPLRVEIALNTLRVVAVLAWFLIATSTLEAAITMLWFMGVCLLALCIYGASAYHD